MDIWADKQATVTDSEVESRGDMARGHIMEPWAIDEFNKNFGDEYRLYHWDDKLIHRDGAAYSPDSLDLPQTEGIEHADVQACVVGEVKSYQASRHYCVAQSNKLEIEQRWQIVMAMYVSPTIQDGFLILFNPSAKHPLFVHHYKREELEEDIETVARIVRNYQEACIDYQSVFDDLSYNCSITEDEIIEEIINP